MFVGVGDLIGSPRKENLQEFPLPLVAKCKIINVFIVKLDEGININLLHKEYK